MNSDTEEINEESISKKESNDNEENQKEEKEDSDRYTDKENELAVHKLIGSIFDDNSKKNKIYEKIETLLFIKSSTTERY